MANDRDVTTYFIRPIGADGPVKIGSSIWPSRRLATYTHWSPIPLEVVVTIDGPRHLERRFHARFEHLHSHHEWFRADPDLTAAIEAIRAGTFDIATLPNGAALRNGNMSVEVERRTWVSAVGRLRSMVKRGYPVPTEVSFAAANQWNISPEERASRRALVRAFMAEHDDRPPLSIPQAA